jgi:hypothetical protein
VDVIALLLFVLLFGCSGEDAWDYSATVKPSEAASVAAPAPKVSAKETQTLVLSPFVNQVATPVGKAARGKRKKKRPEGEVNNSNNSSNSNSNNSNTNSDNVLLAPNTASPTAPSSSGVAEGAAAEAKSSALTSIVYPALSQLLEAQANSCFYFCCSHLFVLLF